VAQGAGLPIAEALLTLGGEDLGNRGASTTADLGVGVSDLDPEGDGELTRHRGLSRTGQADEDDGQDVSVDAGLVLHHWVLSDTRAR